MTIKEMKKEYISPKVIAREIKLDNVVLVNLSNGTPADENYEGGSDAKHGVSDFDIEEEDYYTKKSLW